MPPPPGKWNELQHLLEYCYHFCLAFEPKTCANQPFFHLTSLLSCRGTRCLQEKAGVQVKRWQHHTSKYCNPFPLVRGWGHGAKIISRCVLFFADVIKIFIFLEKIKIKVAPWRFWSKLFRTGFTFAVTLIQYDKIKVELVRILVGHPV